MRESVEAVLSANSDNADFIASPAIGYSGITELFPNMLFNVNGCITMQVLSQVQYFALVIAQ